MDLKAHRHDVCLANAKLADLFVLVLSARFGAPYYADPSLSITWAEFRAASASNVPVAVFVDRRVWNERNACKAGTAPLFTKDPRTFDFVSEIQDDPRGYWMEIYSSPTAIEERLGNLATLFPVSLHAPSNGGPRLDGKAIVTSSLSAEAQHHVALVVGNVPSLRAEDLQWAMLAIPLEVEDQGEGALRLHGFSVLVTTLTDTHEPRYAVRPTPLGKAIRHELESAFAIVG